MKLIYNGRDEGVQSFTFDCDGRYVYKRALRIVLKEAIDKLGIQDEIVSGYCPFNALEVIWEDGEWADDADEDSPRNLVEFQQGFTVTRDVSLALMGWQDESWHNDCCPSYGLNASDSDPYFKLWIDNDDPERRELQGCKYTLCVYDPAHEGRQMDVLTTDSELVVVKFLNDIKLGSITVQQLRESR